MALPGNLPLHADAAAKSAHMHQPAGGVTLCLAGSKKTTLLKQTTRSLLSTTTDDSCVQPPCIAHAVIHANAI